LKKEYVQEKLQELFRLTTNKDLEEENFQYIAKGLFGTVCYHKEHTIKAILLKSRKLNSKKNIFGLCFSVFFNFCSLSLSLAETLASGPEEWVQVQWILDW